MEQKGRRAARKCEEEGVKLRRLLRMGITELACRSRQEASKLLERTGVARRMNGQPYRVLSLGRLQEVAPGCFFEGAVSAETPILLAEHMPDTRDHIIAAAEAISQRWFDLLGYHGLFFGDPIDWRLDPVSKRRAPFVHWSQIDPLDAATVGDSKVIWELNRHQWLLHLGQAYRLTGDERYAETFVHYLLDWMQANPPGMGINWASSLEVAVRLISWSWALCLFRQSRALSPEVFAQIVGGIHDHASHVAKYLSYYFSPNTHLTGEALGLFYAGILFPELRGAGRWRRLGMKVLVEEIERQVLPDGVYYEQSTCYQRYTVEIYLHFLILAARNGIEIPKVVGERVLRAVDFLLAIRGPDGSTPQIGDADGGWILPLVPRTPHDVRGVLSSAAAFFNRSDYAWAADGLAPETLWLLGASGLKAFDALGSALPTATPSRLFPDGGYAVMRSGWDADAHQLIFDVGPLGGTASGGHGHADLLSIQCSIFGEPYLIDPGTYCYTADFAWRDFFRSTAAHSTVVVDGLGQAVPAGPFRWSTRPRTQLRRWLSTDASDFVDASHEAFSCLPDPVVHRRRVLFVKQRYWVIVDELDGAAEHCVEIRFQFAPMEVTVDPALWARASGREGRGLLIRPFAPFPLKAEVREGELAPIQGWVSPDYGQRRPAPVLMYSTVTHLPCRIVTLLVPVKNPLEDPPTVTSLLSDDVERDPKVVGLVFGKGEEVVVIQKQDIVVHQR